MKEKYPDKKFISSIIFLLFIIIIFFYFAEVISGEEEDQINIEEIELVEQGTEVININIDTVEDTLFKNEYSLRESFIESNEQYKLNSIMFNYFYKRFFLSLNYLYFDRFVITGFYTDFFNDFYFRVFFNSGKYNFTTLSLYDFLNFDFIFSYALEYSVSGRLKVYYGNYQYIYSDNISLSQNFLDINTNFLINNETYKFTGNLNYIEFLDSNVYAGYSLRFEKIIDEKYFEIFKVKNIFMEFRGIYPAGYILKVNFASDLNYGDFEILFNIFPSIISDNLNFGFNILTKYNYKNFFIGLQFNRNFKFNFYYIKNIPFLKVNNLEPEIIDQLTFLISYTIINNFRAKFKFDLFYIENGDFIKIENYFPVLFYSNNIILYKFEISGSFLLLKDLYLKVGMFYSYYDQTSFFIEPLKFFSEINYFLFKFLSIQGGFKLYLLRMDNLGKLPDIFYLYLKVLYKDRNFNINLNLEFSPDRIYYLRYFFINGFELKIDISFLF